MIDDGDLVRWRGTGVLVCCHRAQSNGWRLFTTLAEAIEVGQDVPCGTRCLGVHDAVWARGERICARRLTVAALAPVWPNERPADRSEK